MQIQVNGAPKDVAPDTTLLVLIESLALNPKTAVALRNDVVIPREEYTATHLFEGDIIELVRLVGGG